MRRFVTEDFREQMRLRVAKRGRQADELLFLVTAPECAAKSRRKFDTQGFGEGRRVPTREPESYAPLKPLGKLGVLE